MPTQAQIAVDVALSPSTTTPGRQTLTWDASGDAVFDSTCAYSVLVTTCAKKGQYRPNRDYGTLLYTVVQDSSATGSQLSSAAADGLRQVRASGYIDFDGQPVAQRIRPGNWSVTPIWTVNGSQPISRTLRF